MVKLIGRKWLLLIGVIAIFGQKVEYCIIGTDIAGSWYYCDFPPKQRRRLSVNGV